MVSSRSFSSPPVCLGACFGLNVAPSPRRTRAPAAFFDSKASPSLVPLAAVCLDPRPSLLERPSLRAPRA
eukprot:3108784-Pyramimonas_sp.AAC.1